MKNTKQSLINKIIENPSGMTNEEVVKLILSYSFKNDWEKILEKIEDEIIDISSLINIDSMCMWLGKSDENKTAFFKTIKRIIDITEKPVFKDGYVLSEKEWGEFFQSYIGGELLESLCVVFLSGDDRVLKIKKYSSFEKDHVQNNIAETTREAIWCKADKVIIAHNHSSGSVNFSESDFRLTQKFGAELNAVGITLVEHYVVTKNEFLGILKFCLG